MNYNISRKTELYEYVTTTHILCIIVAVCALILSNKVIPYRNYYPLINFRFFALVCLLGFVAVLLYNSKKILLSKNPASFTLLDLVYIMISFLMVIATVYIIGDKVPYIYAVLILSQCSLNISGMLVKLAIFIFRKDYSYSHIF